MRLNLICFLFVFFASSITTTATSNKDDINYKFIVFPDFCLPKIFSFDMECIKLTMSKTLSLVILLGSLAYKVPQILKIISNKSAAGISPKSYIFEMLSNVSNIIYFYYKGIPLKNYGENVSLIIQNFFVLYLMYQYKQFSLRNLILSLLGFGMMLAVAMPGTLPAYVYRFIFSFQMIFFLTARIEQIRINFKNQSTGALSPITLLLSWGGNLARLFTILVDLGFSDMQIILFNLIYFTFNFIPFGQWVLYRNNQPPKKENKEVVSVRKNKSNINKEEEKNESVVKTRKRTAKRE